MIYNLVSVHKHDLLFSYVENENKNSKINGFILLTKGKPFPFSENNYYYLKCNKNCELCLNKTDKKIFKINQIENINNLKDYFDNSKGPYILDYYKITTNNIKDGDNNIYIGSEKR